jgi:hypothetical protein
LDNAFSFSAPPVPLRSRMSPRAVKLAAVAFTLIAGLVAFSWWVIESEHRSEASVSSHVSDDGRAVGMLDGDAADGSDGRVTRTLDVPARADARTALAAAKEAARGRATFDDADPARLSRLERSLIFTDGPSAAPGIVSIASDTRTWATAVMGSSGTCYWLKAGARGIEFGTGTPCTGAAAMSADDAAW